MVEQEVTITAQSVEGSPEGTGSQEAGKAGQPDNQVQETGAPKVEGGEQQTSSKTSERPKPSEWYEARKENKKFREETTNKINQLTDQLTKIGSILEKQQKTSEEPKFPTESEMSEVLDR